jgi:hypothetical protein
MELEVRMQKLTILTSRIVAPFYRPIHKIFSEKGDLSCKKLGCKFYGTDGKLIDFVCILLS